MTTLPQPSDELERTLLALVEARLSRIAHVRPSRIAAVTQEMAARGVLQSTIALDAVVKIECDSIEALARDGKRACVQTLEPLKQEGRTGWDYAARLLRAAMEEQASVARKALDQYAVSNRIHWRDAHWRGQDLEKVITLVQAEVDAELRAGKIAATAGSPGTERAFMLLALEEAKKCKPEDSRVHPRVGVVVVKDGKLVAAGYRGECEPGQHAEYVALEVKLKDEALAGATVYTTLEPCTTRNHPKVPCAKRICERKIRRVVFAMLDPDPGVHGGGERRLRDAGIHVGRFDDDLADAVEELNREFTRSRAEPMSAASTAVIVRSVAVLPSGILNDYTAVSSLELENRSDSAISAIELRIEYLSNGQTIGSRVITLGETTSTTPILPAHTLVKWMSSRKPLKKLRRALVPNLHWLRMQATEISGRADSARVSVTKAAPAVK